MKLNLCFWIVSVVTLLVACACNEPTLVGSELFDNNQLDIVSSDTTTLQFTTIREDSIKVFTTSDSASIVNQLRYYQLGRYNDPVFGELRSDVCLQFQPERTNPNFLSTTVIDSFVLTLALDTTTYGDVSAFQTYDIYRLSDSISDQVSYYSTHQFTTSGQITNISLIPNNKDSITYRIDTLDVHAAPQMRVPLPTTLAEELVHLDSASYATGSNFENSFRGIKIAAAAANSRMVSIDVRSAQTAMVLFYRDSLNGKQKIFRYWTNTYTVMTANVTHNYIGTSVVPFIDNTALGDSLGFIQSLSGLSLKVSLPHITDLTKIVINNATLEFTVAVLPGDDTLKYPPVPQLSASRKNDEGKFVFTNDFGTAFYAGTIPTTFGGSVTEETVDGVKLYRYKMNFTSHLQGMISGKYNKDIYINPYPSAEQSRRVVIYGPKHSTYPAKLKLIYTKI
ncbi:MAG: DUF4270 family protein [Saprospiraceae bacterium]|nr:DUF4270 family protein [Saprospiraceae bacterium]MBP7679450.1 DUF4270 family protein [Saprospiraceae bacterium]